MNIGGGPARYVVATDTLKNVVYVTSDLNCPALWTRHMELSDMHWISGEPADNGRYVVRTRHTGALVPVMFTLTDKQCGFIEFDQPVKTVAAGQSAVLYDGQEVCGGGIIEADKSILERFM